MPEEEKTSFEKRIENSRNNIRNRQTFNYLTQAEKTMSEKEINSILTLMNSDNKEIAAAIILTEIGEGYLPEPLFQQVERLSTNTGVELVPFYKDPDSGKLKVVMLRRRDNDPIYAGKLHVPGSKWLPKEKREKPMKRAKRELNFISQIGETHIIETTKTHSVTPRGDENVEMYWTEIPSLPDDLPEKVEVIEVDKLKENPDIISHHLKIVENAKESYEKYHQNLEATKQSDL